MRTPSASFRRSLATAVFVLVVLTRASGTSDPGGPGAATESAGVQSTATQLLGEDRAEQAARLLDEWLAAHPDDSEALYLRAIAAQKGGNVIAALICLNRARVLRAEAQPDNDVASPWNQLSAALGAALLAHDSSASAKPPVWTWPSVTGLLGKVPIEEVLPPKPKTVELGQVVPATELVESAMLKDPHGQWAATATASSEYGSDSYGPIQSTGVPNVPGYADDGRAWASASADNQEEWLEVTFARPVHATGVRIRQSYNPGAIKQVEVFEAGGQSHVVWSGTDPARAGQSEIAWFAVKFAATSFPTQRIRIFLDSPAVKGWNEIDAVQLLGE